MLSEAAQDYMKQIYLLERRDGKATTSALADAMGVSAASRPVCSSTSSARAPSAPRSTVCSVT